MPGTHSKLRPPAFTASGVEYASPGAPVPSGNWAWLTDIFARVYRVYRWYDHPVTKLSWACLAGPEKGSWCPNLLEYKNLAKKTMLQLTGKGEVISRKYCGYLGVCNKDLSDPTKGQPLCNSLSGVNSGLPCSGNTHDPISGYNACHNAPLRLVNGNLAPQYLPCVFNTKSWKELSNGTYCLKQSDGTCKTPKGKQGYSLAQAISMSPPVMQCAPGSVTYPNGKTAVCNKDTGGNPSSQCPREVDVDATHKKTGSGFSWCKQLSGQSVGHCTNGYESSSCTDDPQCEFTWKEWWNNGKVYPQPYVWNSSFYNNSLLRFGSKNFQGNVNYGEANSNYLSFPYGGQSYNKGSSPLWTGTRWWVGKAKKSTDGVEKGLDIGSHNLTGGRYLDVTLFPEDTVDRYPGAYAAAVESVVDETFCYRVGYCEGGVQPAKYNKIALYLYNHCRLKNEKKYCNSGTCSIDPTTQENCPPPSLTPVFIPGHCERPPVPPVGNSQDIPYYSKVGATKRFYGPIDKKGDPLWKTGVCEGGAFGGANCSQDIDCKPKGPLVQEKQSDSGQYCQPVAYKDGTPRNTAYSFPDGRVVPFDCKRIDATPAQKKSLNPDTDDNICTHNAGYYPRADLCGNDPTKPECLTAYTQDFLKSVGSDTKNGALTLELPPTDVTGGLYSLSYLAKINGNSKIFEGVDERYVGSAYYVPRPPTIAAPDTSHNCASSDQCPIARVGGFSLENQTEGSISYVGGRAIGTIRFYAWAADNQGPLTDIWVDWGDGTQQDFHDEKMKNKKPFCGVAKQCEFVPGLTCQTDNDCPPAAGRCVNTGFCHSRPTVSCSKDADCTVGTIKDTCDVRLTFGNTSGDCQQNYYEYTHAYACDQAQAKNTNYVCGTAKRCSRDSTRTCTTNSDCAPGDTCLQGLAPPGGCYDTTKAACRYTPRVIVKDNWGWCTGECRVQNLGNGRLGSGFYDSHGNKVNHMLFQNGGCYDATGISRNDDTKEPLIVAGSKVKNACDPALRDTDERPWIVFPGSFDLGPTP